MIQKDYEELFSNSFRYTDDESRHFESKHFVRLKSPFGDPGDLNGQLLPAAANSPHAQNPLRTHGQQNVVQPLPPLNEIYGYPQTANPYDYSSTETHHGQAQQPQPQQPQMQSYDPYYGSSPAADIKPTREELLGCRQRTDSIHSVTSSCSNFDPASGFEPQPGPSHDYPRGRVRLRTESGVGSENNDDDVRRKRRRERNKVAAAKCREKKRNQQTQLIRDHATVRLHNQQMLREIEALNAEIRHLKEKLDTHACCLASAPYPDQNQQWNSWGGSPMG